MSNVGTVSKIIAERSEFPKGKREVWYNKASIFGYGTVFLRETVPVHFQSRPG